MLRTYRQNGVAQLYFGLCDGTSPMDGNTAYNATASGTHTGSNGSDIVVCAGKTWTPNQWVGYGVRNTSDPKSASIITSNTADTLYTTMVIKSSTQGFSNQNCAFHSNAAYCGDSGGVPSDRGKPFNVAGVGNIGTVKGYNVWYVEKYRLFFVESSSSIPQVGLFNVLGGSTSGYYTSVAHMGGGTKNTWDTGDGFVIT